MTGQTAAELGSRSQSRETPGRGERAAGTREIRREMDEVRLESAVGDPDLVREARATARASTERSADRTKAIKDEWRKAMVETYDISSNQH